MNINVISRRTFLHRSFLGGAGLGLAALTNIPPFARKALAEGNVGKDGKKLLFIFLRGANDALNSIIPYGDSSYNQTNRPSIYIPPGAADYTSTDVPCYFPSGLGDTFGFANQIPIGNGFNALHPSLKFLAPVYNAGQLALIHRVGYPRQSRSHFDSQLFWENGDPNNNALREGIFYRTLYEAGVTSTNPLSGVSIQSGLPVLFRGPNAALTNISDPTRYDLFGIPRGDALGDAKLKAAILRSDSFQFAPKRSRDLIALQRANTIATLDIFGGIDFTETGNTFADDVNSDGAGSSPYYLFPTNNAINGGGTPSTYAVDAGAYGFFEDLKSAALILNKTDAIIAGTEMGGFDTHNNQGSAAGQHANLLSRIGWAMYALRKYFLLNADKTTWDKLVVVTLTEFGRTTIQNSNDGTDHAEAGVMFVAGGKVKGFNTPGRGSGVIGGHPNDSIGWVTGPSGSMFGAAGRYLKRAVDFRSVLGEVIRDHLGATQSQLDSIIPGYANPDESLLSAGTSQLDSTPIMGEVDVV
ncbi:MAG TPA: DUF1501 domain-containing protein [Candidatus Binatia bacterium]|nr:DUF1501 domain-containing protein [Candidatus Binatia bacterium]